MDLATTSKAVQILHSLASQAESAAISTDSALFGLGQPQAPSQSHAALNENANAFERALEVPDATQAQLAHTTETRFAHPPADISPADLYQVQFSANMLKTQGITGSKSTQELSQDMENFLKQQG